MENLTRAEKRRLEREELKGKIDCNWIKKPSPKDMHMPGGWFGELDRVWIDKNQEYCVMARDIDTTWGKVTHVTIRNVSETDVPWAEKQRIKNELFGEDYTAVEVFPTQSKLVDSAMMYHLWVFKDYELPFSL